MKISSFVAVDYEFLGLSLIALVAFCLLQAVAYGPWAQRICRAVAASICRTSNLGSRESVFHRCWRGLRALERRIADSLAKFAAQAPRGHHHVAAWLLRNRGSSPHPSSWDLGWISSLVNSSLHCCADPARACCPEYSYCRVLSYWPSSWSCCCLSGSHRSWSLLGSSTSAGHGFLSAASLLSCSFIDYTCCLVRPEGLPGLLRPDTHLDHQGLQHRQTCCACSGWLLEGWWSCAALRSAWCDHNCWWAQAMHTCYLHPFGCAPGYLCSVAFCNQISKISFNFFIF